MSEYAVQKIVGKKVSDGKNYYRIKWVGWPTNSNTWEPQSNIPEDLIKQFEQEDTVRRLEKQKKQKIRQLKKQYYPQNVALQKQIKSHIKSSTQGLIFVLKIGDREYRVSREQMLEKHSDLLCKYYTQLARSQNNY